MRTSRLVVSFAVLIGLLSIPALTQDSQGQDPLKRPLTDKEKKQHAKAMQKEKSAYDPVIDGMKWIITDEERAAFARLSNDDEREQFIEIIWKLRDPTPDTEENEYKDEYYRRVTYANEHFSAGKPGWLTDRGHIYIVWGPPDEIESHASGGLYNRDISEGGGSTSTYPFERWRYRRLDAIREQEVVFEFVDSCMCNDYHLTMDPNEKDAMAKVPGHGNPNQPTTSFDFDKLAIYSKAMTPPPVKFADLQNQLVSHVIRTKLVPFEVHTDFVRATPDTLLVPITIQVHNRDITFVNKQGVQRGIVNIFGRVSTIGGKVVQTFEDTVRIDVPESLLARTVENSSVYWKALPLRPDRYKLEVVVKDVNGDAFGVERRSISLPLLQDDKLASSSLIVADLMEKAGKPDLGTGNFVIGDTKVRPRVENGATPAAFQRGQRVNFWMQVYNLGIDEKTHKPSATVEYDIVNQQTKASVLHVLESTDKLANPGEQVTLQKALALDKFDPGTYQLTIKVHDAVSNQTITPTARFSVQ